MLWKKEAKIKLLSLRKIRTKLMLAYLIIWDLTLIPLINAQIDLGFNVESLTWFLVIEPYIPNK
jgi:hypothetical protein